MTSVRTTQRSSLRFHFFTIPFFLIITLSLDRSIAQAEPPFGSAPSEERSLSVPSEVTPLTRDAQAVADIGSVSRQYDPVDQHQIDNPSDLWHSLLPSRDQRMLPLIIQRKNAQPMISLQNPPLLKAVLGVTSMDHTQS